LIKFLKISFSFSDFSDCGDITMREHPNKKIKRKNKTLTLDIDLYKKIQQLAADMGYPTNRLIEMGMRYILEKYKNKE
jgi:hypothetical protein